MTIFLELKNFPVDCQDLTLVFDMTTSYDTLIDKVRFYPCNNSGDIADIKLLEEHDDYSFENFMVEFGAMGTDFVRSCVEVRIKLRRRWQHYFFRSDLL